MTKRTWSLLPFLLVFCNVFTLTECGNSLHTSLVEIKHLWREEVKVVAVLKDFVRLTGEIQSKINEYLRSFKDLNLDQQTNSDFLENPVNAFLLLRHVGLGWKEIHRTLQNTQQALQSIMETLLNRVEIERVPDVEEVDGASFSMGRLHSIYQFNLTALVVENILTFINQRKVFNYPIIAPLSIWDLANIGLISANHRLLNSAVDFLAIAVKKSEWNHIKSWTYFGHSIEDHRIKNFLQTNIKIHDHALDTKGFKTEKHTTHRLPLSPKIKKKEKYKNLTEISPILFRPGMKEKEMAEALKRSRLPSGSFEEYQAERLCRGDQLKDNLQEGGLLFCRYFHNSSPWLRIGPLKGEVLSSEPYIIAFYGMVSDSACDEVIELASHRLESPPLTSRTLKKWTLKNSWVNENESKALDLLTKRTEAITGALVQSEIHSERFMVANYGMGGMYQVHADYHLITEEHMKNTIPPTGDRIATLMTYFDSPKSGGATVWPWLGLAIQPEKGTSVLWWNLYASDRPDQFTRHMACPVIVGSKWIVNKWIGYDAQWRSLQCNRDRNQRILIPVR